MTRNAAGTATVRIQSLGRAAALLDAMGDGEWHPLRNLARATRLAKTTAFNLLAALVDVELAERDPAVGAYRLGLRLIEHGQAVERRMEVLPRLRPLMMRLCDETSETVNLAIPRSKDALIVESLEGNRGMRVSGFAGRRASFHASALGRALLAHRPEEERRAFLDEAALIPFTHNTVTDPVKLERLLAACRRDGWVAEREECEPGGCCVAAPVVERGVAVAAISVAGPATRLNNAMIVRIGNLLVRRIAELQPWRSAA